MFPEFRTALLQILLVTVVTVLAQPLFGEDFIIQQNLVSWVDLMASDQPEEYRHEEFNSGLHALRRGEIIFFGSVPLTFILSGLGWQLSQAAAGDSYPFSDSQHTYNILFTAGGLSLTVAIIDFFLGVVEKPAAGSR